MSGHRHRSDDEAIFREAEANYEYLDTLRKHLLKSDELVRKAQAAIEESRALLQADSTLAASKTTRYEEAIPGPATKEVSETEPRRSRPWVKSTSR
jgi:hypothetical protein